MLNQINQNVLHFENPDGSLTNEEMRDDILGHWMPICRNRQNANGRWSKITISEIGGTPGDPFVHLIPSPGQAGSMDGPPEHPSLTALFSTRTGVGGRHGHGRIYMPGFHGGWVENGLMRSDILPLMQTVANNLSGWYSLTGAGPLVLKVVPRAHPVDALSVTSIVVKSVMGIQRRRNIGVGM